MRDVQFDVPLTVETDAPGHFLTMTRIGQAADFLLHKWPEKRGPKHREALQAIMDVLHQRKASDAARDAFIAAAKEDGVFVRENGAATS
jgi:hypothetical protein